MNRCSIHKTLGLLSATLIMLFAPCAIAPANATTITLDDFATAQFMQFSGGGAQGPTSQTVFGPGSSIIGAARKMTIQGNVSSAPVQQLTSNTYANPFVGNPNYPNPGFWNYETGSMTNGIATLTYDANGAGLGSLLSGLQTVQIHMLTYNAGTGGPGKLRLSITDDSNIPVNFDINLVNSDYLGTLYTITVNSSGINFNNIKSLSLSYDALGYYGADFVIDQFIGISRGGVPEPATLTLSAIAGAMGLAWNVRRRRTMTA